MILKKITRFSSLALAVAMVISTLPSPTAMAAANTIYVTPGSQSAQTGGSFTVQVKGNISEPSYAGQSRVTGTLTFPASLLRVTNVSQSGATMNWELTNPTINNSNGTVGFSQRSYFSTKGAIHIMSVTFQTIKAGTASIGFSSATTYGPYNDAPILTGSTATITNPPPTTCPSGQVGAPPNCSTPPPAKCPSGQTGTPPNCKTPAPATCPSGQTGTPPNCKAPASSSNTPAAPTPATPAAPVSETPSEPIPEPQENGLSIDDATTNRAYKNASLNWKTSSPAKNTVTYGTSLRQLDKTAEVTQEPDGSYTAMFSNLDPGKRYYFTISSESEKDTTKTSTYSGVFTTKGFPVTVNATEDGKPAANAKVKIGEQTYSTDRDGKIAFELASGSYSIEITTSKSTKKFTLAVAEKTIDADKAPESQNFTFNLTAESGAAGGGLSPLTMIGIGVGTVAAISLLGGGFILWRKRKDKAAGASTVDPDYTWSAQQPLPAFAQDQQYPTAPDTAVMNTAPIDTPYAMPPDMAPPEEIMPPDQAVAMAIPEPSPTPEATIDPAAQPQAYIQPAEGTQEYTEADITPPSEPPYAGSEASEEETPLPQSSFASPATDAGYTSAPDDGSYTDPAAPQTQPTNELPDQSVADPTMQSELEITHTTPDSPDGLDAQATDEPGLNDAPPATTSGKGELQIDHHEEDNGSSASDSDNDDTAVNSSNEARPPVTPTA